MASTCSDTCQATEARYANLLRNIFTLVHGWHSEEHIPDPREGRKLNLIARQKNQANFVAFCCGHPMKLSQIHCEVWHSRYMRFCSHVTAIKLAGQNGNRCSGHISRLPQIACLFWSPIFRMSDICGSQVTAIKSADENRSSGHTSDLWFS